MDIDENEINQMDYESSQTDTNENNEHWFCFDDSNITCVTREYIQKHYGLNDCAYMLFYRQKNRTKTRMDCSDTLYSIQQWLLDEIHEKNKTLEDKR
jgi:hypothetical protein